MTSGSIMFGVDTKSHPLNIMKTAYSYVRFSTPEQEMGDSERRQIALAKSYCAKNGLRLSETAFAGRGVSAFHGKHRENGALGRLLKHVQPGEVLLIEDCDRWSREDPLDALTRLREEVRRGIEVVFLRTGVCVTNDNFSIPRSCILTSSVRPSVTPKTKREPSALRPVGMPVRPLSHLGRPFA
jgi:hypothetical protein